MAKRAFRTIRNLPYLPRIAQMIVALVGLSVLIFVVARVLPGDPARVALGPRAPEWAVQALREEMHLNDPVFVQYFYWVRDAFSGNLGKSLVTFRNVTFDILEFLPATIELVAFATIIDVIFALLLGVLSGRYSNTWIDNIIRAISYVSVAVPSFVFAIIFLLTFGYYGNFLPTGGRLGTTLTPPPVVTSFMTIDSLIAGRLDAFVSAISHMIMPALALAIGTIAQEARITRSSMVENQRKDYILSAVSHGIPEKVIMFQYLLKPSVIPTVSVMGLDIASQIGNAFLVETIFNWPGFSKYGTTAILRKDLNAIVGVVMVIGIIFAVTNILIDIIVSYLDPRIRLMHRSE